MSQRVRSVILGLAAVTALAWASPAVAGQVAWRSAQPAPPPGAPFSSSVGSVAAMEFAAPNLGLMMVGGAGYGNGLLVFDGTGWRQSSTVCGGTVGAIAWAGPREWWTVGPEALKPKSTQPIALCHFRDGAVVGSYAVPPSDLTNSYPSLRAAACTGPSDCWFAGEITDQPTIGALYLHWDGSQLRRIVHPAARGVGAMQAFAGGVVAGTAVGPTRGEITVPSADPTVRYVLTPDSVNRAEVTDPALASKPRLLRLLGADGSVTVPTWAPRQDRASDVQGPGLPTNLIDTVALDTEGSALWLAARGSRSATRPLLPTDPPLSGDDVPDQLNPVSQRPYVAVQRPGRSEPEELIWRADAQISSNEVIHDIAAIPGTNDAWIALRDDTVAGGPDTGARAATLARIRFAATAGGLEGEVVERVDLQRPDLNIGGAARLECPAPSDCWLATAGGWIYHWSDPDVPTEQNSDPVFQQLITSRPPDGRTPRDDPDTLPADEAAGFVAPPVEQDKPADVPAAKRIPALFKVLGKPKVRKVRGRYIIELRIQLRRKARIQLVGRRNGRVVAKTKQRTYKKGRYVLRLKVKRSAWPTALKFVTRDLEIKEAPAEDDIGGDSGDTVTTG